MLVFDLEFQRLAPLSDCSYEMIRIVWDEPKREANLVKHGLDFIGLGEESFRSARIAEAKHGRFQAIGRYHRAVIVVIFARLGAEAFSVISMRPANVRERSEL